MSKSINACPDVKMIRMPKTVARWQAAEVITDKMVTNSNSAFFMGEIVYLQHVQVQNIAPQLFYVITDHDNNSYFGLFICINNNGNLVFKYLNRTYGAFPLVIRPERIKDLYLVFESSRSWE
jgi:hypothetical protein